MRALLTAACGILMMAGIGAAQAHDHHLRGHHHHGWHGHAAGVRVIHPGHPAVIERRIAVSVPVAVPVDRPVPVIVERRIAVPVPVAVPVYVQPRLQTWHETAVVHHPAPVYYGHPVVVERRCWIQQQPVYNAFGDMIDLQPQRVCR